MSFLAPVRCSASASCNLGYNMGSAAGDDTLCHCQARWLMAQFGSVVSLPIFCLFQIEKCWSLTCTRGSSVSLCSLICLCCVCLATAVSVSLCGGWACHPITVTPSSLQSRTPFWCFSLVHLTCRKLPRLFQKHVVCIYVCSCELLVPWRPEEGVDSPRTGIIEGCEMPVVVVRNQTWVLCKNRTCF